MRLRAYRESLGLDLKAGAEAIGLKSKGTLSAIETGLWIPPIRLALRIEDWSGGAVRAVDLLAAEDAALLRGALARGAELVEAAA
ncbi:MAG TPA: helix-turn-helix transcriptional regulator [Caulobacteraceae bacterium]|nr:helix-turn-helix transcriptional regulator [Caulobacteraceae bacterium]